MVLKVAGYLASERRSVLCRSEAKSSHQWKMLSVALEEIIAKAHPLEARLCYYLDSDLTPRLSTIVLE